MAIMCFMVYVWNVPNLDQTNKLSLTVLLGTAAIYCFQFMNMRQTSKSQEQVLQQQRDIAQKQHNFDVFTLRMNLRNELIKAFTIALSSEDLTITNDVNIHLVNIGKICDDIKFAFSKNKELDKTIKLFKDSCTEITKLAPEKRVIIECKMYTDDRVKYMRYKECLEICVSGQQFEKRVINPRKALGLQISEKEKTILFGIMAKYILISPTKDELEDYIFQLFQKTMNLGKMRLNKICEILDGEIKL